MGPSRWMCDKERGIEDEEEQQHIHPLWAEYVIQLLAFAMVLIEDASQVCLPITRWHYPTG